MSSNFNSQFNIDKLSAKPFDEDIKDGKPLNRTEVHGTPFNSIGKFNQISYNNNKMGNYNIFGQNFKFWDANFNLENKNNHIIADNYSNSDNDSIGSIAVSQPKRDRTSKDLQFPKTQLECAFCKNNKETPEQYKSHVLKNPEGKVSCPVLRQYDCPICHNGGGDYAHTVRYCPIAKAGQVCSPIRNVWKNAHSSDDKKRFK